jgi:hypothetical protein
MKLGYFDFNPGLTRLVVQLLRESWTIARARWPHALAVDSRVSCGVSPD